MGIFRRVVDSPLRLPHRLGLAASISAVISLAWFRALDDSDSDSFESISDFLGSIELIATVLAATGVAFTLVFLRVICRQIALWTPAKRRASSGMAGGGGSPITDTWPGPVSALLFLALVPITAIVYGHLTPLALASELISVALIAAAIAVLEQTTAPRPALKPVRDAESKILMVTLAAATQLLLVTALSAGVLFAGAIIASDKVTVSDSKLIWGLLAAGAYVATAYMWIIGPLVQRSYDLAYPAAREPDPEKELPAWELSRIERWMLANQYRILEAVYPAEAAGFAESREVLERGYELEYAWLCPEVYPDENCMTSDECREVLDTLDMLRSIKRSMAPKDDKTWADARLALFSGFDGNHEGKQLGYALHLRKQDKYADMFRDVFGSDTFDLNSHRPTLPTYRARLEAWRTSADKFSLTEADLIRIRTAGE